MTEGRAGAGDEGAGGGERPGDPFALRSRGRPLPSRAASAAHRGGRGAADRATRVRRRIADWLHGDPDGGGDQPLRRSLGRAGQTLDDLGGAVMTGGVPAGVAVKGAGKGIMAAAVAPLTLVVGVLLFVVGVVPVTGARPPALPQVEPAGAAAEIPPGYMDAYTAADDEHDVPWPVLAAMGHVLTEHGSRSPYDTVQRTGDQRYPTVDPAIAPGTPVAAASAGNCRIRVVGDSVLAGMRDALSAQLGACTVTGLDAGAGRTISQGADLLADAPLTDETALVVVLGTNDLAGDVTAGELEARIAELVENAGQRPVIWQDVAGSGAIEPGALDAALSGARRRFANLMVVDWSGHLATQREPGSYRAADGVHYTPAGYGLMADLLAREVAAPSARAVDPPAGDGGLGPMLLNPTVFTGLTVRGAQDVDGAVDDLARALADIADATDTAGAENARASRLSSELLPESEELWRAVVAAAPVVVGESACLQPDPTVPVQQMIEIVWRCEMLRTPPVLWAPHGLIDGVDAQNALLDEAHVVAATWSNYGTAACDDTSPHAGVFPLPITAAADRCDPVRNVRTAARLVLDQESRPMEQRPGGNDWERAAAGWATMRPALGDGTGNRFTTDGPPADEFEATEACEHALDAVLDAEESQAPAFPTFSALAQFEPRAVDFDPAHWDTVFATTTIDPLFRAGGACDPGASRAAGFAWLAGRLAARQVDGNPSQALAGAIDYATWVGTRGSFPVAGGTGLVPRLHNPRLVAPQITRPRVVGGAVAASPGEFADRVIEKAKVYAGHVTAVPVEVMGWESPAALGIPEHAARAYVQALGKVGAIEPGCAIDLAYLAGFGYMESGHGTVAVNTTTGKPDDPPPRAPVAWDPLTGESQPRILGVLLDGSGAGGNVTPYPNDLASHDRRFYRQDDAHLRAVGPTQFMPGTWETVRAVADGNDDGVADPFNYYDGALATALKACRDGHGLADDAGRRRAALAYNGTGRYADGVLSKAAEYRAGLAAMGQATAGPSQGEVVALPDGPVSIVDVYGVQVHAAIADPVRALIDAARADGLELAEGSGGWRSPDRQIALRRAHCGRSDYAVYQMPPSQCSPPTARPGTSEHERGLAIDFRCNGEAIGQRARSNPCVVWLRENAARFGLYNLPSEAWHWSTSGG